MALTQISTEGIKNGTITGSDLATNVDLVDNQKLRLGTSQDLSIYHNGSNSYIEETGTGILGIQSSEVQIGNASTNKVGAKFFQNAQVELYYDNSKKLETHTNGIEVTGKLETTDFISIAADNKKLKIGAGDDLQIYHDGTYNRIAANAQIFLQNLAANETYIAAYENGAVELYHDNTKRFETGSLGVRFFGNLYADDNEKLLLGNSQDLQIYHDGTKSYIDNNTGDLEIKTPARIELQGNNGMETMARFASDGAVELFYDNSKKFETSSVGATVTGQLHVNSGYINLDDNYSYAMGTNNRAQLYHSGSHQYLLNTVGNMYFMPKSGEYSIGCYPDGSVELYYDNVKALATTSTGAEVLDGDNTVAFGLVTSGGYAGYLVGLSNDTVLIQSGAGENMAGFNKDGSADLYHNGTKKVETTANGATIDGGSNISMDSNGNGQLKVNGNGYSGAIALNGTAMHIYHNSGVRDMIFGINESEVARFNTDGHFLPSANDTRDLGSTSKRWRNIYTNDLNLSNEGGSNDVDGTWGSYTIQEGAEDLFLVNKRNGKKYKFNLTEVS